MKSKIALPVGLAVGALAFTGLAISAVPIYTEELRDAVTVEGVRSHQWALQFIADANGGVRLAGTLGHDESAAYVAATAAAAGYDVTIQDFEFVSSQRLGDSIPEQTAPLTKSMEWLKMKTQAKAVTFLIGSQTMLKKPY